MTKKKPFVDKKYRGYTRDGKFVTGAEGNNGRQAVDMEKRFKKRIEKKVVDVNRGECWIWKGPVNNYGRAQISRIHPDTGKRESIDVRKAAWLIAWHTDPVYPLRSTCGVSGCVNPRHLQQTDRAPKRALKVFTDDQVRDIRQRYNEVRETIASIRQDYPDASDHSIYCAATGRSYKGVK